MKKRRKTSQGQKPSGILHGHQRVKQKLVAPFSTFPQVQHVSYVEEILPEILHIAMAFDAFGFREGMKLCKTMFSIMVPLLPEPSFPLVSELGAMPVEAHDQCLNRLHEAGCLENIRMFNTPITMFYPAWPLVFLGRNEVDREIALEHLESCVARHLDRFQTPACAALAAIVNWQTISGKLHYPSDMTLPNLDAIVSDPGSEEAEMASSHVRAFTMAYFGQFADRRGSQWAKQFWEASSRLGPCRARADDNDDA